MGFYEESLADHENFKNSIAGIKEVDEFAIVYEEQGNNDRAKQERKMIVSD